MTLLTAATSVENGVTMLTTVGREDAVAVEEDRDQGSANAATQGAAAVSVAASVTAHVLALVTTGEADLLVHALDQNEDRAHPLLMEASSLQSTHRDEKAQGRRFTYTEALTLCRTRDDCFIISSACVDCSFSVRVSRVHDLNLTSVVVLF